MNNLESDNNKNDWFNLFYFQRKPIDPKLKESNWESINEKIENVNINSFSTKKRIFWITGLISVAAVFILFILSNIEKNKSNIETIETKFAEIKKLTLPDGSMVTLNANSLLKMPKNWSKVNDREIWLEGEAFFEVSKKPQTGQKFIVHTNYADIVVLGTKFNINTRRNKSIVVLEEGKISLFLKGNLKKQLSKPPKILELKPGQVASIDSNEVINLNYSESSEHIYSRWTKNEFHFNNTSLKEISQLIEDIYGYKMIITNPDLLNKSITGDLRASSLIELVEVLKGTFNLDISIEDNNTLVVTETVN